MKLNRFFLNALTVGVVAFTASSCRQIETDGQPIIIQNGNGGNNNSTNTILASDITAPMTLKAGNTYTLRGIVYVKNNAVLTIEPGTKIQGEEGAALVITRGAQINATGTATSPIVFTSSKPIPRRGDWGGVILLGNAPTNSTFNGQTGVGQIEGVTSGAITDQLYGGTNANDNSGTLKYVRIEYAGFAALPDKEINGLTMGGVGRGTTIDYVQVSYANDDSFEWFGGTVNCKHLIAYKGLDDDFDTDNGFAGSVQFGIGVRDPQVADISGSNGFESDNDANGGNINPQTSAVFSNMTMIGPINSATPNATINSLYQNALQIRRNSSISIFNSVFMGWPVGLFIDATKGTATDLNIANNKLVFQNNILAAMTTPLKYGPSTSTPTGFDTTQLGNWFNAPANGNSILASTADVKLTGAYNPVGTLPNFSPASGSPLLTGGTFTNPLLTNANYGFMNVTYRGAVKDSSDAWYAGWTNFNL